MMLPDLYDQGALLAMPEHIIRVNNCKSFRVV